MILDMGKVNCLKALEACSLDTMVIGQEGHLETPGQKLALCQELEGPGSLFLRSKGHWPVAKRAALRLQGHI